MSANVRDIDHGWKNLKKEFLSLKQPYVKVGVLSNSGAYAPFQKIKFRRGKVIRGRIKSGKALLADVAAFNEFGTSTIPSRPFMAQTFDQNISQTRNFIAQEYGKVLDRKQSISQGLYKIGIFYQSKTQDQMVKGNFAPNKAATVRAKGSSRPLIDTGRLRQSINFEVVLK
jgi:HK97 gp10 family phage protein